jgi:hypothetical protein
MATLQAKIMGSTPGLLMHNERLADPTNKISKQVNALATKKKKSDAEFLELKRVEWFGGLYLNSEKIPAVPVAWILAAMINGAKKSRLGPLAKAGLYPPLKGDGYFPLIYDGPKDLDQLFEDGRFVDYRIVRVTTNRIMRSRPVFPAWSLDFSIEYDEDTISPSDVDKALERAGTLCGLGDHRPQYGRFIVESVTHGK